MSSPDIVICLLILLSALIGLVRGLVKEVLSLVIWIAALVLALIFSPLIAELLVGRIDSESIRLILAFASIFIAALICGALIQWVIAKLIESTGLTGTDRVLGFLFGGLRGVLLCVVILIILQPFARDALWWSASQLIPELIAFETEVVEFLSYASGMAAEYTDRI